ncbi:alpha/beta hydrolase [Acidipila sp. EB88]|uniref:alpha/beta hydrolase n=1 Tax=Acidipila sp. EB88 TaxID=2305226 RepID=UPI000F5DEB12|nr:alpha/beta hydrolase [Acidipila sp. EB88]RRA48533.1 alpha/beta hydrolase [Acidipila sp. EB88]
MSHETMNPREPIDPALRRFLDEQAAASQGPVQTAEDARARMLRQLHSRVFSFLPNAVTSRDVVIDQEGVRGLAARVYTPPARDGVALPVLVYLHGGGWVAGSVETHDPFCRLLAQLAGVMLVSLEYSRAPEHPFPKAIGEAEAAVSWVAEHAGAWGGDPALLALGGDSAGANLAAVAANRLALRKDAPRLKALALLYPVTDHPSAHHGSYAENATGYGLEANAMRWYWEQYAPGADPGNPEISPLRHMLLPPLPPTLVTTAEYDVLRDEGIAYARFLKAAGVNVTHIHAPDMHHNFAVGPSSVARFPQSERAAGEMAAWLRTTLAAR